MNVRGREAVRSAGWACLAASLLLAAGCETGRTNKMHAAWEHANDLTTTGKPETVASTQHAHGQTPVPGSPTAAGEDGNQPLNDSEARGRETHEKSEEMPMNRQPASLPGQK